MYGGGFPGGFGIYNYESADELAEALATTPATGFATVKVYSLVSPELVEKLIQTAEQSLSK